MQSEYTLFFLTQSYNYIIILLSLLNYLLGYIMKVEEFDAIAIGAGLSGLRAAPELSQKWKVAVISKVHPVHSHSGAAQGGR